MSQPSCLLLSAFDDADRAEPRHLAGESRAVHYVHDPFDIFIRERARSASVVLVVSSVASMDALALYESISSSFSTVVTPGAAQAAASAAARSVHDCT